MWIVRRWKSFVVWVAIIVIAGCAVGISESFQDCEHTHKNHKAYRALYEKRSIGIKTIIKLELHTTCTIEAAHENEGPLTLLATILIAGFTGTLWFETNRLYRAGEKQIAIAKIAADAAKQSADALVNVERPWLVPVIDHEHITDVLQSIVFQGPAGLEVPIRFVNEGRTSAFPGFFYVSVAMGAGKMPDMGEPFITRIKKRIISPGGDGEYPLAAIATLTSDKAETILDCKAALWFLGRLEYSDFFGKNHVTGFCFTYDTAMGFEPWGGETYNYMT